jgi:hypothetical protein
MLDTNLAYGLPCKDVTASDLGHKEEVKNVPGTKTAEEVKKEATEKELTKNLMDMGFSQ